MLHSSLVKALNKAGHVVVSSDWNTTHHYVKSPTRIVSWYSQGDRAICVNSRRHDDEHDSQNDYSAGYFCDTIKCAVKSLGEAYEYVKLDKK